MIVIPGRIPVIIHPFFWLIALLIGWINSPLIQASTMVSILLWVLIVFVSVLFHEFGHAITAVCFQQRANIQLVALGGLTSYEGPKLRFLKQFIIVFNGPLFGLILCGFSYLLLHFQWPLLLVNVLKVTFIANLFWSAVNLLPVLPLDGGQLLRIAFEAWFGLKGYKASLLVGALLSTLIALASFLFQQILIGALFFLFAYQSFDMWRKARLATTQDRDDAMARKMAEAEVALQEGRKSDAERIFAEIRENTASGLLHMTATQYLAVLKEHMGSKEEAYQLLLPIEEHLAEETRCILHRLAAEHQNWELVAKLSSDCYQIEQTKEIALRNARAFAFLHQPKPAGGWLQTAWRQGGFDLETVLKEDEFQSILQNPEFQHFLQTMR